MVAHLSMISPLFRRLNDWWEKWAPLVKLVFGVIWTATAIFLVVIAFIVFAQQESEHVQRAREARTVRTACVRSRVFGPPLIDFLELAEARLHTGALERELVVDGKRQSVIGFYRATIPRSCPGESAHSRS